MVFATETSELPRIEIKPEALTRLPLGVASPLWGFYASAALSGVAYWWMTQWTRPVNLEALFNQAAATAQPVVDAVEAVTETVVEALAPPEALSFPVGGEAAPISPTAALDAAEAVIDATAAPPQAAAEFAEAVSDAAEKAVATTTKAAKDVAAAAKPDPKPAEAPRSASPKAKSPSEAPRST